MMEVNEMARLGGLASAKKRLAGKTKEEISDIMKKLRLERTKNEKNNHNRL